MTEPPSASARVLDYAAGRLRAAADEIETACRMCTIVGVRPEATAEMERAVILVRIAASAILPKESPESHDKS